MSGTRPLVTACIVTWNSREQIGRCIDALLASQGIAGEIQIVVVDNDSADGTAAFVREAYGARVTLIANDANRYYAAGNNQAFAVAEGEHVLILNPDAYVEPDCLATLLGALESDSGIAAVAPRLILPDGSVQRSCRRFPAPCWLLCEAALLRRALPRTRAFGGYFYGEWDYADAREVDQPMTSCMLLRSAELRALGGFDESFEMFFNDVDLCYRLRERGGRIRFVPEATCLHDHGASTRQARRSMVRKSQEGMGRFYDKHYRPRMSAVGYALCRALIAVIGAARLLLARRDAP